jgi:hypothetical protein
VSVYIYICMHIQTCACFLLLLLSGVFDEFVLKRYFAKIDTTHLEMVFRMVRDTWQSAFHLSISHSSWS